MKSWIQWSEFYDSQGFDNFVFQYKLCKVRTLNVGPKGVPYVTTHDGRTIRYPDPLVKVNDTVKVDIVSGKIESHIKFDSGNALYQCCRHVN